MAKLLLSRGANFKFHVPNYGTVLHLAALTGLEEITKLLITAGADINTKVGLGCTALQTAVVPGRRIIALLLLDHGADVHIQGSIYTNALQAAQDISDVVIFWRQSNETYKLVPAQLIGTYLVSGP